MKRLVPLLLLLTLAGCHRLTDLRAEQAKPVTATGSTSCR